MTVNPAHRDHDQLLIVRMASGDADAVDTKLAERQLAACDDCRTLLTDLGAIRSATERLQAAGRSVAHAQVRHLNPLPQNTGEVLGRFRRVLVPEVNLGQLLWLLRARYLVDAVGYDKVRGKPLRISEIEEQALRLLDER